MVKKLIKRYSTSLIIRKMKLKLQWSFKLVRIVKIGVIWHLSKKTDNIKNWQKCKNTRIGINFCGKKNGTTTLDNSLGFSKFNIPLLYCIKNVFIGIHNNFIPDSQTFKTTQYPWTAELINEMWYIHPYGMLFSNQKELLNYTTLWINLKVILLKKSQT